MMFTNVSGESSDWTLGFERDGRELLIVVAKATYHLPVQGEAPRRLNEAVPLVEADCFTGEPGLSAPTFETDYAHRKPACDVLLVGSAYVPAGRAEPRTVVGLRVDRMTKQFAVVGPRHWQRKLRGFVATMPSSFRSIGLTYDVAFGGTDRTDEKAGGTATFLSNPVGRGFWRSAADIDGKPLPNTEALDATVCDHDGTYAPMAFSPIGRHWSPRVQHAGTYDQAWLENTAPFWPDDFDHRYFQAAPPDQIIPYPQGGEEIVMRNLTEDGYRAFRLPRRPMPVTFITYGGRDVTILANIDTIVLEPDEARFTITWRANLALARSVFDVRETVVGEMSSTWYRARRFPGKTYYESLGALVAGRRDGT